MRLKWFFAFSHQFHWSYNQYSRFREDVWLWCPLHSCRRHLDHLRLEFDNIIIIRRGCNKQEFFLGEKFLETNLTNANKIY